MNAVRLPRTSQQHVVLTGAMWNFLCDTVERLDRFAVAPPLYLMRDDTAGRVLAVNFAPGISLVRVKVTDVAALYSDKFMTVVEWDGSTEGREFVVRALQGHAVDDETFAIESKNGTDVADVTWMEYPVFDPKQNSRYQVLQLADTVGRFTVDDAKVAG